LKSARKGRTMSLNEISRLEGLCSKVKELEKKLRLTAPRDVRSREIYELLGSLKEIILEADNSKLYLDQEWRKLNTALEIFNTTNITSNASKEVSIRKAAENIEFVAEKQEELLGALSNLEAQIRRRIDALSPKPETQEQ
jgi:hypothetical protein